MENTINSFSRFGYNLGTLPTTVITQRVFLNYKFQQWKPLDDKVNFSVYRSHFVFFLMEKYLVICHDIDRLIKVVGVEVITIFSYKHLISGIVTRFLSLISVTELKKKSRK